MLQVQSLRTGCVGSSVLQHGQQIVSHIVTFYKETSLNIALTGVVLVATAICRYANKLLRLLAKKAGGSIVRHCWSVR